MLFMLEIGKIIKSLTAFDDLPLILLLAAHHAVIQILPGIPYPLQPEYLMGGSVHELHLLPLLQVSHLDDIPFIEPKISFSVVLGLIQMVIHESIVSNQVYPLKSKGKLVSRCNHICLLSYPNVSIHF